MVGPVTGSNHKCKQHVPVQSEHVALLWVEGSRTLFHVRAQGSLRPGSSLHMKVFRPLRVQNWAVKERETVTLWVGACEKEL